MASSLLALAVGARDALLLCGPTIFREGDDACIGNYTAGMSSLVTLLKRLEAGWAMGR